MTMELLKSVRKVWCTDERFLFIIVSKTEAKTKQKKATKKIKKQNN